MTFREGLAATRDRVLPSIRARGVALARLSLLIVGLLAVCLVAVVCGPVWWAALYDRFITGYEGQIIVNSPSVYTRQRLVNDRLSQSAWLQEQLRVTTREFDSSFRSIDEVRSIRNSSLIRGEAKVGASGAGSATPSTPTPSADDSKNEATVPTVQPTSADIFRAKNAYREEVRAEIMETQLDDRHDIQGNTIYRLSFDATVLPGTRSDALAVIKVKLLHDISQADNGGGKALDQEYFQLYEDWLRYMQKIVQKSVEKITPALYERKLDDRIAQTLPLFLLKRICEYTQVLRLDSVCDPITYPDNDSPALKATSKKITEYTEAYLTARREILQGQLKKNILTAVKINAALLDGHKEKKNISRPEALDYALDESYLFCQQAAQKNFHKTDWSTGETLDVPCPVVNGPFEGMIGAAVLYSKFFKDPPDNIDEANQVYSDALTAVKTQCSNADKAQCTLPDATRESLRCLAADYMWSQLNLHDRAGDLTFSTGYRFDKYFRVHLVGRETGMCNVVFLAKERAKDRYTSNSTNDPVKSMKDDLNSGVEVYAYTITPKNLAQRLSTASDTRDAMQALLNANFGVGGRDVSSLIETLNKKSTQSQAIQALPIVVGYGLAPAVEQQPPYTEFGWVIAPQITFGKQDERKHSDRQYALAAVVSVPSWWRSMSLAIETCWVDRGELHKQKQFTQCGLEEAGAAKKDGTAKEVGAGKQRVRLPGVISELSRKLGYEFVQEPRLDYRYPRDGPLNLEIGRPAQVLLMGGRIWRSTEVTLGAQKADEIAVLPNMEGVLAKFRCVRRQAGERLDEGNLKGALVEIRVWTSEGVTEPPEWALLVEPPPTEETKGKRPEMCPEERQEMQAGAAPAKAVPGQKDAEPR